MAKKIWSKIIWSNFLWSNVKWSNIKWSNIEWSNIKWPKILWLKILWPKIKWSNFFWSSIEWPKVNLLLNPSCLGYNPNKIILLLCSYLYICSPPYKQQNWSNLFMHINYFGLVNCTMHCSRLKYWCKTKWWTFKSKHLFIEQQSIWSMHGKWSSKLKIITAKNEQLLYKAEKY